MNPKSQKIKIIKEDSYVASSRNIHLGDVLPVLGTGTSEKAKRGQFYLVNGKGSKKRPIVIYADECIEINK